MDIVSRVVAPARNLSKLFRIAATFTAVGVAGAALAAGNNVTGEKFVPGIWVDPDGCEHWVFDDGLEGFMTPNVTRDGRPVCRSTAATVNTCAQLRSDQLFRTGKSDVSDSGRHRLEDFFAKAEAKSFIINGYTDSQASEEFNLVLSERRAIAVANIALATGAKLFDVRGYGENNPKASNQTAAGRAENRRVEIVCVN